MATTGLGNGDIAEMFNTFPFATDQEYQVSDSSIPGRDVQCPPLAIADSLVPFVIYRRVSKVSWRAAPSVTNPMKRKRPRSGCLVCSISTSMWSCQTLLLFFLSFHFAPPLPRICFTLPRLFALDFRSGSASPSISHHAKPSRVTGNSITLEDASSFESSARLVDSNRLAEPQQQQAVAEEAHTLSFAELKALIEQGKTDGIPNNKLIPNVLNVSTPIHSRCSPRESVNPALSLGCSRTLQQTTILDRLEGNHGKHNPYPFLAVIY